MDATERRAEIARLRGVVAAAQPDRLLTALPDLARLLAEEGAHGEARDAYFHAARVLGHEGYYLKAAAALHAAESAAHASGCSAFGDLDTAWDELLRRVGADAAIAHIILIRRLRARGERGIFDGSIIA